jgi:sulfatase maturation enzyme AslB (radical SAM superfamily)
MELPSNTYCPAPWRSLSISGDKVAPCCWWYNEIPDSKIDYNNQTEILHSKTFEDIRRNMLNGEKIPNCNQCYTNQQIGLMSERDHLLKKYGVTTEIELSEIRVFFDNLCNLKCRGCNSGNSHLWATDEIQLYGKTFAEQKYIVNSTYQKIDYRNIKKIHFEGGELFYSKRSEEFLYNLYEKGNINELELSCITNCTKIPPQKVLDIFLQCKYLGFSVSIDGIGELNDYFRNGSNFENIKNNLNYFYKLFENKKNINFEVITTVNVYNINKLKEIEEFLKAYPKIISVMKPLEFPSHMSIKNLPQEYKNTLRSIIKNYGKKYNHLLNFLDFPGENLFGHFINFHEKLNEIRKETLDDKNQLLENFIAHYKKNNLPINSKDFLSQEMDKLIE